MSSIHKGADSAFLRCVAALLFLAACAWCGAGLYARLRPRAAVPVAAEEAPAAALRLSGLCLRREEPLALPASAVLLIADGQRAARGAPLARLADGALVTAGESALYCADSDGLEALSVRTLTELTPAALRRLAETAPPSPEGLRGRLVYDSVWYFAALAPEAEAPETPRSCRLRFAGFSEWLPARLVAVGGSEEGRRALLFRLSRGGAYLRLRWTEAEYYQ